MCIDCYYHSFLRNLTILGMFVATVAGAVSSSPSQGPKLLMLDQDFVAQGLAYHEPAQAFLVSGYCSKSGKKGPVVIQILPRNGDGSRAIHLKKNGDIFSGHGGGICIAGKYGWLADGRSCWRLSLDDVLRTKNGESMDLSSNNDRFVSESIASIVAYHNGVLWVGEFAGGNGKIEDSHTIRDRREKKKKAWISGYRMDTTTGWPEKHTAGDPPTVLAPNYALSVRLRLQGVAINDKHVVISTSQGRTNYSCLACFRNPVGDYSEPHARAKCSTGSEVPVWFLDGENFIVENDNIPRMAEGIELTAPGTLAAVYESAAKKYKLSFLGRITAHNADVIDYVEFRKLDCSTE